MVHEVNSSLMCPHSRPSHHLVFDHLQYSMPGNVLQAIKNCTVGRLGNKATLSISYMPWDILVMLS